MLKRLPPMPPSKLHPLYFVCIFLNCFFVFRFLYFFIIRQCRMCWFVWQEAASIKVAPVAIIGRLTFGQMNDRPLMMMMRSKKMVMTMTIMTIMTIVMISMIMMSHQSCFGCNDPQIYLPANERSANQKPTYEWSTNERLANCCQSIRDKCVNNQLATF